VFRSCVFFPYKLSSISSFYHAIDPTAGDTEPVQHRNAGYALFRNPRRGKESAAQFGFVLWEGGGGRFLGAIYS